MRSKRVRDSSSGNESSSNEDQENDVLSTSKNRIVAPGIQNLLELFQELF